MTDTDVAPFTTRGADITVTAADGDAEAYLVRPDDDADHPGVLFIIDAIGLRRQTRRMADRIASWGYVVLVPNVFYRWGTAAEDELLDDDARAEFFAEAMPRVHALTDDLVEPDLSAYIDALRSTPGVSKRPIGVTGYCMGGRSGARRRRGGTWRCRPWCSRAPHPGTPWRSA